jgi:uncharacterized tellurite resistance protein B-like protein
MSTNWTKEDLMVYTLIYCANADLHESKLEVEYIKSKILNSDYDALHHEFKADKDYQAFDKICSAIKDLKIDDTKEIINEIMKTFNSDGKYSTLEQVLFKGLNKII